MLNDVTLIGRLGQDPRITSFENGKVTNMTMATWYNKPKGDGTFETITEWHRIVTYQNYPPKVEKGDMILVKGNLRTREYEDNSGIKRYVTEIVGNVKKMPQPKPDTAVTPESEKHSAPASRTTAPETQQTDDNPEDDLPF